MLEAGGMNAMPYLLFLVRKLGWSAGSPEITSLTSRYLTMKNIYGGTNEIQKNIIAKQVLKYKK